jgi:hypothetical protein
LQPTKKYSIFFLVFFSDKDSHRMYHIQRALSL